MQHCKPINTHIAKCKGLSWRMCPKTPQEEEYMRKVPYTSAVGILMYAMMYTRLDICFVVGIMS